MGGGTEEEEEVLCLLTQTLIVWVCDGFFPKPLHFELGIVFTHRNLVLQLSASI